MEVKFQFLFPMNLFPIKFFATQDPLRIIRNDIYISKFSGMILDFHDVI